MDRDKVVPFIFFKDTATTEIYTLSLHDALPISHRRPARGRRLGGADGLEHRGQRRRRSEEHTSELQSHDNLVCPLLLENKTLRFPPQRSSTPPTPTPPTPPSADIL